MKTWLYLPLLLLVFVFSGCTKTTNEVVIPNTTISVKLNPADWEFDSNNKFYFKSIKVPELNNVNASDGVVVSIARYDASGAEPKSYELLPQVLGNLSYFVIHDNQFVEVDIKGLNGTPSAAPTTPVIIKIVLIPSVIVP
jgi:hypothetical protein